MRNGNLDGAGSEGDEDRLAAVLNLMSSALNILDETDAPADIGAQLDLARERLQELILGRDGGQSGMDIEPA